MRKRNRRRRATNHCALCRRLIALVGLVPAVIAFGVKADSELAARGEYLFHASLCAVCHTAKNGAPLAGGRPIPSPFGTFYSTNITPHPEHGIGRWLDEDFVRALRYGLSPTGEPYYPAFPYTSFTRLTRDDLIALKAILIP